jgi:hypothetical protein
MAASKQAEYSEDGVDLTLIRWMLSLTPAQRLEFLEQQINSILEIRELQTEGSPTLSKTSTVKRSLPAVAAR